MHTGLHTLIPGINAYEESTAKVASRPSMYGHSHHVLKNTHGSEEYKETNKTEPTENEEWYIENIEWPEVGQLFNMSINIVTTKIIDDHFNMITQNKEQGQETNTCEHGIKLEWKKHEESRTK